MKVYLALILKRIAEQGLKNDFLENVFGQFKNRS